MKVEEKTLVEELYPLTYFRTKKRNFLSDEEIRFPFSDSEIFTHFQILLLELEPESLTCDGENTEEEIQFRLRTIWEEWSELENILEREVEVEEVELYRLKKRNK